MRPHFHAQVQCRLLSAAAITAALFVPSTALARPKLAVMEIQDQTRSLSAGLLESLTDSLRTMLTRSGQFIVIDKSRQAAALKKLVAAQKKESYKACYDSRCQIPLGQALAADSILRTKISRVGSLYLAFAELVDLEKEAVTAAAQAQVPVLPGWGRDDRLLQAVLSIARQLSGDSTLGLGGGTAGGREVTPIPGPGEARGPLVTEPRPGSEGGLRVAQPTESAEELRIREERARELRAERERLALEVRQRNELNAANEGIRRKRAVHLVYGWMSLIGGGILGATGLYYMFGKAGEYRGQADEATSADALKSASEQAHKAQVAGGVVLGLGGAAMAAGLALVLTAPKLVKPPVNVAGMELERLPTATPAGAQALLVRWGGKF